MENKVVDEQKKQLFETLSPRQKDYFEAIDWLFNGGRATGRTHLICVVALTNVINGGSGLVMEHAPSHEGVRSYTKSLLISLANKIELPIKIHDIRNGFVVTRLPEMIEYEGFKK